MNSRPRAATVRAMPGAGRLRVATLGEKAFTRLLGRESSVLHSLEFIVSSDIVLFKQLSWISSNDERSALTTLLDGLRAPHLQTPTAEQALTLEALLQASSLQDLKACAHTAAQAPLATPTPRPTPPNLCKWAPD